MRNETSGDKDGSTVHTYDVAGRRVRTTNFDPTGVVRWEITYEYSAMGTVSGWSAFKPAGVLFKRFERRIERTGLDEITQYGPDGQFELRTREIREGGGIRLIHFGRDGKVLPG
jgi:hypothetical protein